MQFKYGISNIIKHKQGYYQVAFLTPERTTNKSVMLWFIDKNGQFIANEPWPDAQTYLQTIIDILEDDNAI